MPKRKLVSRVSILSRGDSTHSTRKGLSSSLRCFRALEILAREPYSFTLGEISTELSAAKSSVHRFMATLLASGFVEQDPISRRYMLTGKALWVGAGYLRHSSVYRCGLAVLEDLANRANTTCHLAVLDNGSILILHTAGPPDALNLFVDVGERRPVHANALGKVMLAYQPEEDVARVFSAPVHAYTPNTITSFVAMQKELARIRHFGFGVDNEEAIAGIRCVAAPIRTTGNNVVAAVAISGTPTTINDEELTRYARMAQESALRISIQLGYRPPTSDIGSLLVPKNGQNSTPTSEHL